MCRYARALARWVFSCSTCPTTPTSLPWSGCRSRWPGRRCSCTRRCSSTTSAARHQRGAQPPRPRGARRRRPGHRLPRLRRRRAHGVCRERPSARAAGVLRTELDPGGGRAPGVGLRPAQRDARGQGGAVSSFARQIGSRSDLTVHVRLDEGASAIPPGHRGRAARIAQEAMNNARKHSGGQSLWVSCTVRPPFAEMKSSTRGGMRRARQIPRLTHGAERAEA